MASQLASNTTNNGGGVAPEDEIKSYTIHRTAFHIPSRYEIVEALGYGGYGYTVRVRDTLAVAQDEPHGVALALKKLEGVLKSESAAADLARQLAFLKDSAHPNILRVRDVVVPVAAPDLSDVYVVYEQLECSLAEVLRAKQDVSKSHVQHIVVHLARGLKYLHDNQAVLGSLSPEGVQVGPALAAEGAVRIGDLVNLHRTGEPMPRCGVENVSWYAAPEYVMQLTPCVSPAMDMWSLGCLILELYTLRPTFAGGNYIAQLQIITDAIGRPNGDLSWVTNAESLKMLRALPPAQKTSLKQLAPGADKAAIDLVKRLLTFNPADRITAGDVLKHPFCAPLAVMSPVSKQARTRVGQAPAAAVEALPIGGQQQSAQVADDAVASWATIPRTLSASVESITSMCTLI